MDFFERQERARKKTFWLVGYFVMAVLLIILSIHAVLSVIFLREQSSVRVSVWLGNTDLLLGAAVGTLTVVMVGSFYKMFALRQGGASVALSLGGRPLLPNTRDPAERKLRNIIEEMSIASGTPVPEIYVLPGEGGINAFAAGHSPRDAAIGVTRGGVEMLTRDELQGVIAHEYSHILNGDMRLNLRLIGVVHGILCIALIGRILLRTGGRSSSRSSSRKGGNPLPLVGLALLVIGGIGVFFGRLIKSGVSRQREYLADASAVQFTRNPLGLAGALKKIGGLSRGSLLQASHAEEASHLFFGNGLAPSWFTLLSTHPPLEERIKLLDPAFDGTYPPVRRPDPEAAVGKPGRSEGEAAGLHSTAWGSVAPLPIQSALPNVGAPTLQHLNYAAGFQESVPQAIWEAAHEPLPSMALICALLLSANAVARATQLAQIQNQADAVVHGETARLAGMTQSLDPRARLPLALLCISALRHLSLSQYDRFAGILRRLMESDQQIDLFEYALQKIVMRHLEPTFHPSGRRGVHYYAFKPVAEDCAALLSALAWLGDADAGKAEAAFRHGTAQFKEQSLALRFLPAAECDLVRIDAALNRLALASPPIRKMALEAFAHTVAADGVIQPPEAELLRAIADAIDCPIPPYVQGV